MPGDVQITLKKFDITRIRGDDVVVMIGRRNTGISHISHIAKNILYYHRDTRPSRPSSPQRSAPTNFTATSCPPLFIHDT
jgi:hypothetical protein